MGNEYAWRPGYIVTRTKITTTVVVRTGQPEVASRSTRDSPRDLDLGSQPTARSEGVHPGRYVAAAAEVRTRSSCICKASVLKISADIGHFFSSDR